MLRRESNSGGRTVEAEFQSAAQFDQKTSVSSARSASEIWKYGDPESHDLRQALAAHHGVAAENIMVGEGIDSLLGLLVRLTPSDRCRR